MLYTYFIELLYIHTFVQWDGQEKGCTTRFTWALLTRFTYIHANRTGSSNIYRQAGRNRQDLRCWFTVENCEDGVGLTRDGQTGFGQYNTVPRVRQPFFNQLILVSTALLPGRRVNK